MLRTVTIGRHLATAALGVSLVAGMAATGGATIDTGSDSAPGDLAGRTLAQALDAASLRTLGMGETAIALGVPVDGRELDLELERFDVWAEGGTFMIDDNELSRPSVTLLRGSVVGEDGSQVVIGIGDHATNGFIRSGGNTYSLSTGGAADLDKLRAANMANFEIGAERPGCGLTDATLDGLNPTGYPVHHVARRVQEAHDHGVDPDSGTDTRGSEPCRVARIALDSDWEWTQEIFGGNANASAEYALFLLAGISEVYQRDVNVRLVCSFLRTWSGNNDPYTGGTSPDPLDQVRDHWRANMGHVGRELTHLLTGANTSYGGVAYLSVICNEDFGYGVSSYMDGSFPYPLQENSYNNWDLVVMSHELGHNFGTLHTHDGYSPPIDNCGNGCTGNLNGTIMSYCHICSGGLINIDLRFHPLVMGVIGDYLQFDAQCNLQVANAANDDTASTGAGQPVDIFVLGNDSGANCDPVGLASVQSPTPGGGTATIEGWNNATGDPTGFWIEYTPGPSTSGTDTFTYTTTAGQTANVAVDIEGLRPADGVDNPRPGLDAGYYEISQFVGNVPDFGTLSLYESSVADQLNFASTSGPAVGGSLDNYVAAEFVGYLDVPEDGVYTLSLESDDGSILWIGDEEVVNNDGLHGMQTQSGAIGLEAGAHELRVGFFEAGGGAGLIFRWNGPTVSGVVPASALLRDPADDCGPADIAEPFGVLDLADVSLFALGFQIQDPAADIAEPFGVWDLGDIAAFVDAFLSGCP